MNEQLVAALAGRYVIERELGHGGMATVYLATDSRHHRKVAVKVLHPELTAVIGAERFLKEIELTASLQHPHILPLFDSGDAAGQLFYVMPFVEGETLRARLDRERQLPIDDAIRIASEVASALEYAHKRHVVHRDVKPENVLLHDGAALVADFGIALAVQDAGGERITQTGLSLGTPQYMAPEQAMGERSIGPRADIYALGAVTYEMLVGEPPFTGPTAQSIVAKMMTDEPAAPSRQRRSVSPALERAVLRALEKLPADRWPSAQAFADALAAPATSVVHGGASGRRTAPLGWGVAAIAAALATWGWLRRPPAPSALPPSRLSILVPGAGVPGNGRLVDISPDGERIVFTTYQGGASMGNVQELSRDEATSLPALRDGIDVHFSADGRSIYFGDVGHAQLQRASIEGGAPVPLRGVQSAGFMADAPDGSLWLSTAQFELLRVAPDGSVQRPLANVRPRLTVVIMQIFADGRSALVKDYNTSDGQLAIMDLTTGALTPIFDFPVVEARYAVGYLVFVRADGSLYAAAFDADAHRATGPPVQIGENVSLTGSGIGQIAVARNGTIVYVPAQPRQVMLVDRTGKATPLSAERRNFHMPRFSPDGKQIAVDFPSVDGRDVWMLDRATGTLSRVTSEHDGHDPVWSPDGSELLYTSIRHSGIFAIYRTRPGSGVTTKIAENSKLSFTGALLPDGRTLFTQMIDLQPGSQGDLVRIDSAGGITPVVAGPSDEAYAAVSPDARWVAFTSGLTGTDEVYVRPLSGSAAQVQISRAGGTEPMWSHDGRELFYRAETDGHTVFRDAVVDPRGPFRVLSQSTLFAVDEYDAAQPHANYDVAPDGKSFAMVHRAPTGRLVVIQNLPELMRRMRGIEAR